jgi:hypothetical protein
VWIRFAQLRRARVEDPVGLVDPIVDPVAVRNRRVR